MSHPALTHFAQADPQLHQAVLTAGIELEPQPINTNTDQYFEQLCGEIASQQLSGKVAEVIWQRFLKLFPEGLTAEAVLALDEQVMRDAGLSWAKVRSIRDLAEKTHQQKIRYQDFPNLSDEEIIQDLIQVKGIGRWTAEMFLIFTLGREDVFSFGDLGLKNSFAKVYQVNDPAQLPGLMLEYSQRWSPYRSYAARALWRLLDQKSES